jgi:hypothetical protein
VEAAAAESETDGQPQPAAALAVGAKLACEPLRVGLAPAPLVALTGQEAERVEVVAVHGSSFVGRCFADPCVWDARPSLRLGSEQAANGEQTAA